MSGPVPNQDTTVKRLGMQRDFLIAQHRVIDERLTDIVRGGRHRHFGKSNA
jgi:hypothetical protein